MTHPGERVVLDQVGDDRRAVTEPAGECRVQAGHRSLDAEAPVGQPLAQHGGAVMLGQGQL